MTRSVHGYTCGFIGDGIYAAPRGKLLECARHCEPCTDEAIGAICKYAFAKGRSTGSAWERKIMAGKYIITVTKLWEVENG